MNKQSMDKQEVIEFVATEVALGLDPEEARRINAGDGFTIDHSPDGQWWTRTEGLQLSQEDLEKAIVLGNDPDFGWEAYLP